MVVSSCVVDNEVSTVSVVETSVDKVLDSTERDELAKVEYVDVSDGWSVVEDKVVVVGDFMEEVVVDCGIVSVASWVVSKDCVVADSDVESGFIFVVVLTVEPNVPVVSLEDKTVDIVVTGNAVCVVSAGSAVVTTVSVFDSVVVDGSTVVSVIHDGGAVVTVESVSETTMSVVVASTWVVPSAVFSGIELVVSAVDLVVTTWV